ncbi:cell division regulator GpsB [Pueribacillus theae]|uniref:Cell cycle protein GpsB n=1 Tax=Pueribacillus theae TaxID=2171751 RepID=A0A2U1JV93_9BACI|nr:cell division regulator GpsB [Pueribacillus theae]PWA08895.1 cell division regulator GpsB [Pueribacillus theae]
MKAENNIQLTPKEILEKDFKTGFRGYKQDEVDKFLDIVIKDYDRFQDKIEALKKENARLNRELNKLSELQKRNTTTAGNTNYDILKRLSNLEKHVFGSKLHDED